MESERLMKVTKITSLPLQDEEGKIYFFVKVDTDKGIHGLGEVGIARQGNAISNAAIFVENDGKLFEIRRMEVHEHSIPILGQPGHTAHRLVMKTQKKSPLIIPTKLKDDY